MANYGINGFISFSKLWILLRERGENKTLLRNNGIHTNTISKLVKNENVTCEVIAKLCELLDCQPSDIMEYVPQDARAAQEPPSGAESIPQSGERTTKPDPTTWILNQMNTPKHSINNDTLPPDDPPAVSDADFNQFINDLKSKPLDHGETG